MMKSRKLVILVLVVILAFSFLACSVNSLPNPFATQTPTPTVIALPTAIPVPFSTPIPALAGLVIEVSSDNTTRFTDRENNLTMLFPPTWMVLLPDPDQIDQAAEEIANENPDLAAVLGGFRYAGDYDFCCVAFDLDPDHNSPGFPTSVNIIAEETPAGFSLGEMIERIAQLLVQQNPDTEVMDSGTRETANNLEIGFIDLTMPSQTISGENILAFMQQVYFQIGDKTIIVTLTIAEEVTEPALTEFEGVVESIELLEP